MPNWCSNSILITGSKNSLKKIATIIESIEDKENDKFFRALVGIPEGYTAHRFGNWFKANEVTYDLNVDWFGCKWDVSYEDACPEIDENFISLSPPTAWSPPLGFAKNLAKKFGVRVEVDYEEQGSDFWGKSMFNESGELESQEEYSYWQGAYIFSPDYFWDAMQDYYNDHIEEGGDPESFRENYCPFISDEELEIFAEEC
jgi:hypothetical protein